MALLAAGETWQVGHGRLWSDKSKIEAMWYPTCLRTHDRAFKVHIKEFELIGSCQGLEGPASGGPSKRFEKRKKLTFRANQSVDSSVQQVGHVSIRNQEPLNNLCLMSGLGAAGVRAMSKHGR